MPTLESVLAGYGLKIATYPDGVKAIDCGVLEVDTDTDVDAQLEALGLARWNDLVTAESLPFAKKDKLLVPVKLINLGRYAQTPVVEATIKRHAPREGNLLELLAIDKAFPELVKFLWMVAFGSRLFGHSGNLLVPVLLRREDKCGVNLNFYENEWNCAYCWFVAAGELMSEQTTSAPK